MTKTWLNGRNDYSVRSCDQVEFFSYRLSHRHFLWGDVITARSVTSFTESQTVKTVHCSNEVKRLVELQHETKSFQVCHNVIFHGK
jgi:hypothetical protein